MTLGLERASCSLCAHIQATFPLADRSGVADALERRGIQYLDCYCVDNALSRVADPELVGRADLAGADVCEPSKKPAYCCIVCSQQQIVNCW